MPMPPPGPQSISSRLFFPLCRANFRRNPAGNPATDEQRLIPQTRFIGVHPWHLLDSGNRSGIGFVGGGPPPAGGAPRGRGGPPSSALRAGGRGGRPGARAPAPHGFTDVGYLSEAAFFPCPGSHFAVHGQMLPFIALCVLGAFCRYSSCSLLCSRCGTKPCLFLHR